MQRSTAAAAVGAAAMALFLAGCPAQDSDSGTATDSGAPVDGGSDSGTAAVALEPGEVATVALELAPVRLEVVGDHREAHLRTRQG